MIKKAKSDSVDVRVQTVHYNVIGNKLHASTSGFQIVEADEPVAQSANNQQHHIAVEFEATVPPAVVIDALRTIQKTIESHGLPKRATKMNRREAAMLMRAKQEVIKINRYLKKMPPELRAQLEPLLNSQPNSSIREQTEACLRVIEAVERAITAK